MEELNKQEKDFVLCGLFDQELDCENCSFNHNCIINDDLYDPRFEILKKSIINKLQLK